MRRALGTLAALALAACQVEVEGARCSLPGTDTDCPSRQACGNDNRCSEQAAACRIPSTRCDVGETKCTGDNVLETCTNADPVCGSWAVRSCKNEQLLCVKRGANPHACECPANTTAEFTADPLGSPSGAVPYPTGLDSPRVCRFRKLRDAVDAAVAHGGMVTVRAHGAAGDAVTFGSATGETFPLAIPEGTTLVGASGPGQTTIEGDAASAAPILAVQGGTVERVRIANVSMTGNGVDLSCGATAAPALRDVTVSSGARKLAIGVNVTSACGALLERVDVSGASGPALEIDVPATAPVTASGSRFHGSLTGVHANGGVLTFQQDGTIVTEVTDNAAKGIDLVGATAVDATLTGVLVARNGGTGIVVSVPPVTSKVRVISCDVHSNATTSPTVYGSMGSQRNAGGILLTQASLSTFRLEGNRIYANDGGADADGLAFYSSGAWTLNPGSNCSLANAFGCLRGKAFGVSITTGGTVDARASDWDPIPPPVNGTVLWDAPCPGTAPACPP